MFEKLANLELYKIKIDGKVFMLDYEANFSNAINEEGPKLTVSLHNAKLGYKKRQRVELEIRGIRWFVGYISSISIVEYEVGYSLIIECVNNVIEELEIPRAIEKRVPQISFAKPLENNYWFSEKDPSHERLQIIKEKEGYNNHVIRSGKVYFLKEGESLPSIPIDVKKSSLFKLTKYSLNWEKKVLKVKGIAFKEILISDELIVEGKSYSVRTINIMASSSKGVEMSISAVLNNGEVELDN